MVGPARKREAVGHLQRELEMSERRACKVVGQPRSTQRYLVAPDTEELQLRQELRQISRQRPRAGYRMAARCLHRSGWRINDKRVQRLCREEGLKVGRKPRKRTCLGSPEQGSQRSRHLHHRVEGSPSKTPSQGIGSPAVALAFTLKA